MTDPSSELPRRIRFSLGSLLAIQLTVACVAFFLARQAVSSVFVVVVLAGGFQAVLISGKKRAAVMGCFGSLIAWGFFIVSASFFAPMFILSFAAFFGPGSEETILNVTVVFASMIATIIGGVAGARVISEADRYGAITRSKQLPS